MSEFTIGADEELRSLGEVIEDLRDRAAEMLGRVSTRMGFGEVAAYDHILEMGEDKKEDEQPEVIVEDKEVDGKTVHIESLKPGSAGPGTGEGTPVPKDKK